MNESDSVYTDYLIIGGNGFVVGIKDDAPDVAKIQFNDFLRKKKKFEIGD